MRVPAAPWGFWCCVRTGATLDAFLLYVGRNLVMVTACMGVSAWFFAYQDGMETWECLLDLAVTLSAFLAICLFVAVIQSLLSPARLLVIHPAIKEWHRTGRMPRITVRETHITPDDGDSKDNTTT